MSVTSMNNNTTGGVNGAAKTNVPAPTNPKGELGADSFMKLLVAELKSQDPSEPMNAREMVAQLAQLSSVQKLTTIDEKLGAMDDGSMANATLQSAALIGRNVTASANRLSLTGVNNATGSYQLQAGGSVSVEVVDSTGKTVKTLDLGAQKAGTQSFQWDGKTSDGTRAANGSYKFKVSAKDEQGKAVPVTTEISGLVSEVTYQDGAPAVVVAGAQVALSDVTRVAQ